MHRLRLSSVRTLAGSFGPLLLFNALIIVGCDPAAEGDEDAPESVGDEDEDATTQGDTSPEVDDASLAADSDPLADDWQPPSPQMENLCEEFDNVTKPPVDGHCDVELKLTGSQFVTGQGVSEGRGEISVELTAEPIDGLDPTYTEASLDTEIYNVGEYKRTARQDLGTYRVNLNTIRRVEVCAEFTEHDNGGTNGGDDIASGCHTIELFCSPNDSNNDGRPDGQATLEAVLGPYTLCGDNVCLGSAAVEIEVMSADADSDGVPNDLDATPEPCDEFDKATAGLAAVVYFHFDNDWFTTIFQEIGTNLSQIYNEYDYVVLIADNGTSNILNLQAAAFSGADRVYPPTRDGMLGAMRDLTADGWKWDTYVWAHGYKVTGGDSSFETLEGSGKNHGITDAWLRAATEPNVFGTARGGIPMIAWWSTTCIAARQIDAWVYLGAVVAGGAPEIYFYPTSFGGFFSDWISGRAYRPSAEDSHTAFVKTTAETLIDAQGAWGPFWCLSDDPLTPEPLDGPGSVTGLNACAEDFFNDNRGAHEAQYNIQAIYDTSLSGAENMEVSSTRQFVGNANATFGAPGHQWP